MISTETMTIVYIDGWMGKQDKESQLLGVFTKSSSWKITQSVKLIYFI